MSVTYELLGGKVTFDEDVQKYGRIKKNFNLYYDQLEQKVIAFYRANVRYVEAMYAPEDQKYDYTSRLQAEICMELNGIVTDIIKITEDKGIKGKTREDYVKDNPGLEQLFEISGIAFAAKVDLWNHGTKMATRKMHGDQYEAVHVIQKDAYGHRVSDAGEALLKEMKEDYDKKEAAKPVLKKTSAAGKVISRLADDWFDAQWMEHFLLYSENVLTIIYNILDDIVDRVMKNCVEAGLFSAEVEKNVDLKRSNELLHQAEGAAEEEKKEFLRQALEADPSNRDVYVKLLEKKYLEDGVLACARDFDQAQMFLDVLLQDVDTLLHDIERDDAVVAEKIHGIAILQGKEDMEVYRSLYGETIQEIEDAYAFAKAAIADDKKLDQWIKTYVNSSIAQVVQYSEKELNDKVDEALDRIIAPGLYKEFREKELLLPEHIRLEGSTATERKVINGEIKAKLKGPLDTYMKEAAVLWEKYVNTKERLQKEEKARKEEIEALKVKMSKITIFSFTRTRKSDLMKEINEKEHKLSMYRISNNPQVWLDQLENKFGES